MKINWFKINKQVIIMFIKSILIDNHYQYFLILLKHLKISSTCLDCVSTYFNCKCNYCEYCKSDICICDIDLDNIDILTIELSKELLSKELIRYIIRDLNNQEYKKLLLR